MRTYLRKLKQIIFHLTKIGPTSILDELLNLKRSFGNSLDPRVIVKSQGSVSGNDSGYMLVVRESLSNPSVFNKFKSNKQYRKILEHVNRKQGYEYLEIIDSYEKLSEPLERFIHIDKCKPFRFTYPQVGRISPSNLRYAKVSLDIESLFGDLTNFKVAEIGVGYGGQFHALSMISKPSSYFLYDIPIVTELATKYLCEVGCDTRSLIVGDFNDFNPRIDLVISNYAFSELERDLQEIYLNNVILNSSRGYLIYNQIMNQSFDTIGVDEFVSRIPGAEVMAEVPLTASSNKLIVWGHTGTISLGLSRL